MPQRAGPASTPTPTPTPTPARHPDPSAQRRRILFVNHEVECGGAELSLLELLEGLDRARFEPHLACSMEGPLTDRARQLDVAIHFVPMLFQGRLRKLIGLLRATRRLRQLVGRYGIDLVHTNSMIAGYCGILAARRCRVPAIWHVRDIGYPEPARWMCTQAGRIVANSLATAAGLRLPPRHQARVEVVYNGIAPAFFAAAGTGAAAAVRQELSLPTGARLIGTFGRLDPGKGHRDFLHAAKPVIAAHPDTFAVIVGDTLFAGLRARHGAYRAELEQLARELGLFGRVLFLGQRRDVPRLMAAMDVIVQPSTMAEAFGRSIAEAQAVGRPVVGSELGGIPEIIEHGVTGLLFPAGDRAGLAAAMQSLLDDPPRAAALGRAARARAAERFTQERHATDIEAIYTQLLGAAQAAQAAQADPT